MCRFNALKIHEKIEWVEMIPNGTRRETGGQRTVDVVGQRRIDAAGGTGLPEQVGFGAGGSGHRQLEPGEGRRDEAGRR